MKRRNNTLAAPESAIDVQFETTFEATAENLAENTNDAILNPEFLLEHLEGELEASLQDDMEVLLMNSLADRRVLKSLARTREILRAADDVLMPEDGRFYDRLHASIMCAIADESWIADTEIRNEGRGDRNHDRPGRTIESNADRNRSRV